MTKPEQYAKLICLFLAEQLRVKKIGLKRAAEIAQKVVANINLIDSEGDFLRMVKDLTVDFEELVHLEQRVFFWIHTSQRRELEVKVRAFVIDIIPKDPQTALAVMLEAIKDEATIDSLRRKFPEFTQYLTSQTKYGSK